MLQLSRSSVLELLSCNARPGPYIMAHRVISLLCGIWSLSRHRGLWRAVNADLASILRIVFIGPASGLIKHNQLTRKTRSDRRTAWNFDRHRQSHTTTVHNGYVPPVLPTSATARLPPRTALLRGVELWLREGAQPVSAARALSRASERPAVGQRLGPVLRPSWPPVLESSPPRGTACGVGRTTESSAARDNCGTVLTRPVRGGIAKFFGRIP